MSDQKQENKKSQIVDSENVPSESSINAEFKDSDTSKEESKRQQMSLERNLEKSTVDQTREDLKEPMEDTGVDLEPSVEQQSAVEKSALSGKVAKSALPGEVEMYEFLSETEKSTLPEEAGKSALPAGAETSVLPEKNMLPAGVETSVLPEKSRLPAETSVLPEKNMLPAGVETSVLPEKSRLQEAVRQRALPEKTEHAVVEKLWTRGKIGAAVVVLLIAIGFAMCANPFGGPQTLDSRSVLQIFQGEFKRLQKDFPEQNDKLWLRSGKMLTNHLNKSHPDEPAMIILTAAQDAKRTLQCLGSGLAQTYAVALNSSWLLIHGPSQAQYDASTAKLNIDEQLSAGFETENRAAVLNNLETLPPGSLLIFFKYCDHENAAYKNVALVFTVLLEDSSLEPDTPLPELEEKVRDFLWQQFVHSVRSNQEMDSDKLSGVWSRISHLVLPVLPVERIETGNCPFDHE
ncbi:torsin-1A-interacting protein 2 isoform X12 [Rana temporaria]|uniref:torsin-1A-interacting protein 2 isoform X12 n=1 Tax=Rana temporaria TaxID=8407 RepID=UPI001AAC9F93|nr:torsin-1A-interacting protein 2 isoform X12 [Rana temporaria]